MTTKRQRQFNNNGNRKGAGQAQRARSVQIVAGDFTQEADVTNETTGETSKMQIAFRAVAKNRTAIDPAKGPASALWDINMFNMTFDRLDPYVQGVTYDQMRGVLAQMQFAAMGRPIDISRPTDADLRFVNEQKNELPRHNIFHHLGNRP